ncbi:hypothetical protein ACFV6E_13140 [Streptomyces sp. NPDC059785]|uniref:hypothetical protein n=1 Tax=Streptomyces sp. NPDC059785 TaxID=3346945 RepID=UPI003668C333
MRDGSDEGGYPRSARLLPWGGPEGKRAYLLGDGTGPLSRLADAVETAQLDMAVTLLGHADDLLDADDPAATSAQLRYLLARMREALADVHRVAESRGTQATHCGCG